MLYDSRLIYIINIRILFKKIFNFRLENVHIKLFNAEKNDVP